MQKQDNEKQNSGLKLLLKILSGYYVIILIGILCIALLFTIMFLI